MLRLNMVKLLSQSNYPSFPIQYARRYQSDMSEVAGSQASKPIWWEDGLSFSCTQCGKCCARPGSVFVNELEIKDLAKAKVIHVPIMSSVSSYWLRR